MTDKTINNIPASPRETIVVMQPDAGLRASAGRFETITEEPITDLKKVLKKYKANLVPMFGVTEERVEQEMMAESVETDDATPQLSRFYMLEVADEQAEEAADAINKLSQVEAAYVKPGAEPPVMMDDDQEAPTQNAPPVTPSLISRQGYLDPSPIGVDAHWAWARAGGRGQNVRIIDIEGAWRFTHEDMLQMQGGVVGGTQSTNIGWRNHGTAVLGVYSGDHNGFGVSGICDKAVASAVSIFGGMGSAGAIRHATQRLRRGDVMLLELHRPGPRHNFQSRNDQKGYIAIEWWEDDYAAILAATQRGIIVVEAAGNGAEDLDDAIYQTRPSNFPSSWSNSFQRSNRDSGAIMVGAGAPPPGTHGRTHGPDRSRLEFSNYGALIDAQGWGREVTTCGYGDLQGGHEDVWYTDTFSGTSSASPIVVGAIASLQGMARARGVAVLSPAKVRQCLRATGATQTDAPNRPQTQRIGNRPDIKALYQCAFKAKEQKEKEHKEGEKYCKDRTKEKEYKEDGKNRKEFIKELEKNAKEFEKNRKELIKEFEKNFKENIKEKNIEKRFEQKQRESLSSHSENLEDHADIKWSKEELFEEIKDFEDKDIRRSKRFKERIKERIKDSKEKDGKEFIKERIKDSKDKEGKELIKDRKEKDRKEGKELIKDRKEKDKDRKEFKELKEFKEKDKDRKEFKEKDKDREDVFSSQHYGTDSNDESMESLHNTHADDIENRMASLEMMVGELTHFITAELRPDLVQSAQDYAGSQGYDDPEVAAQMAKDEKDVKDNEAF